MNIRTPIKDAGRAMSMYASRLKKLHIETLYDFLFHFPTRYDDFSRIVKINEADTGEKVTIHASVLDIKNQYLSRFKTLQKALLQDDTGTLEVTWFNQPYLTKNIMTNDMIAVSGKVDLFRKKLVMQSPEFEPIMENQVLLHTSRLVPIYPETRGVSSKWLRRQIFRLLQTYPDAQEEFLPEYLVQSLMDLPKALFQIHFPDSLESVEKARTRLAFDELFLLQLKAKEKRTQWSQSTKGAMFAIDKHENEIEKLKASLPFLLTNAQEKAVNDIFSDLQKENPMNRLLQGDVGSGKTVVAAISMYAAFLNGFQSVLMAPTEILAAQHFTTISKLLSPFGVKVDLVTGSKKLGSKIQDSRFKNENNLASSIQHPVSKQFDILIGTHAVLSEKIQFEKLGFVAIDEQQRFGVEQRTIIREKGNNPHLLTMTATPIPRTVALTLYGDLDVSYLTEMPKGRKVIKTWLVPVEKRDGAYEWIRKEILENDSQVFIICPFIEESESMSTIKAAKIEYELLQKDVFPDLKLGLLHGKQKAKEKDEVLSDFREKQFQILVATPVVEVGIDIPNATVIMIEASERFGLAGLHQLRGRVGRGEKQSYCLLFTQSRNPMTIERLKAMEKSNIGAELAELDLRLRGPGDIYGTAQSGSFKLKIASFSDFSLIERAKEEAEKIYSQISNYPSLQKRVEELALDHVSPD